MSANRKLALGNINKSSLKNDTCVIQLNKNFKNTKNKKSVPENRQMRWEYKQKEHQKNVSYHFNFEKKSENKNSLLENKPKLWRYKQKASKKNVISLSSIHSGTGDETVKKSENNIKSVSVIKQSNKQIAPLNNYNFTQTRLVDEAGKIPKNKKLVSENKQSQWGHKQITKKISYSSSIHELGDNVRKSSNEKWVPKNKQSILIYTQTAHPKNICYFCSSHKLNEKVENFKNKESVSESKQSVWRYKQTAPPKTVSYFTYLFVKTFYLLL